MLILPAGASAVGGGLNNTITCGRGAVGVGSGAWAVASGSYKGDIKQ